MYANFERALAAVLAHEGGYVNHPDDPGGATNLGVTIGTAKRLGIDVDGDGDTDIIDIKLLKPADAAKVYRAEYWDKVAGNELAPGLDYAVFDFAVNSGVQRAAIYLQEILDVAPDGKIGRITVEAAARFPTRDAINELCDDRVAFLKRLSTWPTFGKGWMNRVKGVRALALTMCADYEALKYPKTNHSPSVPAAPPKRGFWASLWAFITSLFNR